jgi:vacuolar-type H+-ATPase subunit F/Vma7
MKMFVMGSREAVLGMRLARVAGRVVEESDDPAGLLDEIVRDGSLGILLIPESVAGRMRDRGKCGARDGVVRGTGSAPK